METVWGRDPQTMRDGGTECPLYHQQGAVDAFGSCSGAFGGAQSWPVMYLLIPAHLAGFNSSYLPLILRGPRAAGLGPSHDLGVSGWGSEAGKGRGPGPSEPGNAGPA